MDKLDAMDSFIAKMYFVSGALESISVLLLESKDSILCNLASPGHVLNRAHEESLEARKLFDIITDEKGEA